MEIQNNNEGGAASESSKQKASTMMEKRIKCTQLNIVLSSLWVTVKHSSLTHDF